MARPEFVADDDQKQLLAALARLAKQRKRLEAQVGRIEHQTDELIAQADAADIPIEHIARNAGRTRKTVYRHLGRPMK